MHVFALHQDPAWFENGHSVPAPLLESLHDDVELRPPQLPDEPTWHAAVATARDALGPQVRELRNAAGLFRLGAVAREVAHQNVQPVAELDRLLAQHRADLGLDADGAYDRLQTAAALRSLLETLAGDPTT